MVRQGSTKTLCRAAHAVARNNLATAFGHVSMRAGKELVITPPLPLSQARSDLCRSIPLDADELPPGIPKEAWLHLAIYRARPDVAAICRAQPEVATALASAGVAIQPLHGQGTFCGVPVPVFTEAELVRDSDRGVRLARALGDDPALILKGNGALTVAADPGRAVARMWVLEASARMNTTAAAAGNPTPLSETEQAAWRATETELLGRIWAHLDHTDEENNR
ncbi:aldolase [Enemella evansiae]|uniref:Aldolase n=1 Tax=Enemella evansiae TaxID=2016499 RepID=A0A255G506_9ACTN|nr:class II aldolase/adducin family protein [Enemella evansiae]OYO09466.1 aldolase [Enemella evansiae]OYO20365.1 aldolase [Enemella evansiae]